MSRYVLKIRSVRFRMNNSMEKHIYLFDGVSLPPSSGGEDAMAKISAKLRSVGIGKDRYKLAISKRSVDARKKNDIKLIFSVSATFEGVSVKEDTKILSLGARKVILDELSVKKGEKKMAYPPLVVGMGPAGMFCALILAENGYKPIIIDRGDSVEKRVEALERFYTDHILDTESNIQFGAGGAGTFSDGKLLTRINDPKCAYVLETFAKFGAPDEITVKAKPHIGTDILRKVVDNILSEIERLGGRVIYRCRLESLSEKGDGCVEAVTSDGIINASSVILALGHSARDTNLTLIKSGFDIIPKPISVGVRIEHKRSFIEEALYGKFAGLPSLGAAEYALSDTSGSRGVYTFCMCPGGEVVAAASEEGGVVVNGMSHFARDGENSNSAVAVSVRTEDFPVIDGSAVIGAIEFQRKIERAAYAAGGGGYAVPIQTVGDFLNNKRGSEPSVVKPTYMGGNNSKLADMNDVLPNFVCDTLKYGLSSFDRKIKGFASDTALLSGAETRTSSPLRMQRGENFVALGKANIYPCGEGAGYAGGITSAAVDGIKVALAIIEKFAPFD